MKKFTLKQILFTTLGVSAIASVAVTIPLVSSLTSRNFDQKLKEFVENKSSAKNLPNFDIENKQEIEELAKKLQLKSKFSERLDAYDALNLHYDKSYNFDINDAIDFSDLQKKFPNLTFKILAPESKNAVKISQNTIKDLLLSVTNLEKTVNFTTKISLDFSKKSKNFQFIPENLNATINLSKLDFLKNKTATEIAILFYKDFYKNYKESKDEKVAIFKTFSKFGGVSLSLSSDSLVILPSNYELKPDLQLEKLVFSNVNDLQKSISLSMILFDKLTNKSTNFSLKFVDFPPSNENFGDKFLQAFSQNYELKPEITKYLSEKNSKVKDIFQKKPSDLVANFDFISWFKEKDHKTKSTFLSEIKDFFPGFEVKNVDFKLGSFHENQAENDNLVPINLQVSGNFLESNLPAGLNFGNKNEYTYNFKFNFDASSKINSSYFENAIKNFDLTVKDFKNLNFKIKKDLPITIFASTIDNSIKDFLNKPLELKNITKIVSPLFQILNFSVNSKEIDVPGAKSTLPAQSVAIKTPVSTTLFEEMTIQGVQVADSATKNQSTQEDSVEKLAPEPKKSLKKMGDYLKSIFDGLSKSNLPPNTFVYLSTSFEDEYTLEIKIESDKKVLETLKIKIEDVARDNVAYKALKDSTKTDLFLDWQTNVETKIEKTDEKNSKTLVTSISSIDNSNLKFVPGQRQKDNWNLNETKPFISEKNDGIYLTDSGLDLQKSITDQASGSDLKQNSGTTDLKLKIGKTFVYVFKPTKRVSPMYAKYFLLKTTTTEKNKNNFGLLIKPYNTIFPNILSANLIGYESEKTPSSPKRFPDLTSDYEKNMSNGETIYSIKTQLQSTYNGKADIKLRIKNHSPIPEINLSTKNSVDSRKDFLSQPDATVMLVATVEKNENTNEKNKQKLKFSLYTSEHKKGLEPVFNWKQDIEFDLLVDLSKNLTLGTTKTIDEKWPPSDQPKVSSDLAPKGGITFKALALFDKPKTDDALTEILRKFQQQYFIDN
ncbi:P110/LppT family adhesin N-terminal domain [Mycoplasma sp. 'Moose RK']|uniref:P110/LppT family adhesin N-terminal domain n=1 Tax=Mycoplasma sp. 'Moose RK' TaxID=2780095 RepID=UPI0018C26838|nr:P110/LppT family adhesin N-terminal domain [Mycoplasma sp. 'Moose RK']MBG0730664.1 P110/LppT family adhesin N-terminal domain [Mycoplasma sp. 'Moose RK']